MSDATWTVAQAKAKFSELVERARERGPQLRHAVERQPALGRRYALSGAPRVGGGRVGV